MDAEWHPSHIAGQPEGFRGAWLYCWVCQALLGYGGRVFDGQPAAQPCPGPPCVGHLLDQQAAAERPTALRRFDLVKRCRDCGRKLWEIPAAVSSE